MIGVHIREVSDEQAFILGYDRRSRDRDIGLRAVFSEHIQLDPVHDATSAGLHRDAGHVDAIRCDVDTLIQLVGIRADQSFDEFGPDAVSVFGRSGRRRPIDQFRYGHQHHASAGFGHFDQSGAEQSAIEPDGAVQPGTDQYSFKYEQPDAERQPDVLEHQPGAVALG